MAENLVQRILHRNRLPRLLFIPHLMLDSDFAAGLLGTGARIYVHDGYQRPVASVAGDGTSYLSEAMSKHRASGSGRRAINCQNGLN